mgnify:CR=1 FL=1
MGAIVFALDTKLNRNVALKAHLGDQGAYFVKM